MNIKYCLCIILIITNILLIGCKREEKKDEYKFIEYIKVEGIGGDDHARIKGKYEGEIVHWYNVTKDTHSRYGSVSYIHKDTDDYVNNVIDSVKNPHKYKPPHIIDFQDLKPEDLIGDELLLKGISKHLDYDKQYEATCALKVIERLDYFPSSEEQEKLKQ
jgi:hypothetical protein